MSPIQVSQEIDPRINTTWGAYESGLKTHSVKSQAHFILALNTVFTTIQHLGSIRLPQICLGVARLSCSIDL